MARVLRRVVVDTGPIVSVLLGDRAAAEVASALEGRECSVSVVNVAEVLDVLIRAHRTPIEDASEAVDRFLDELARPITTTRSLAEAAALIRARHYHRRDRDVPRRDRRRRVPVRDGTAAGSAWRPDSAVGAWRQDSAAVAWRRESAGTTA